MPVLWAKSLVDAKVDIHNKKIIVNKFLPININKYQKFTYESNLPERNIPIFLLGVYRGFYTNWWQIKFYILVILLLNNEYILTNKAN